MRDISRSDWFLVLIASLIVFANTLTVLPALAWVGDIPDSGCSALGLNYLNPDSPASIATDVIEQVAENYNGIYDPVIVADANKILDDTYVVGVDTFSFVMRFHSPTLPILTHASSATFQDDLTLQVTGRRNLIGSVSGTDYSFTGNFGSSDTQNINSAECFDYVAGNPVYEANYVTNGGIIYENYTSGSSSGGSGWVAGTDIIPCFAHPYYTNSDSSADPLPNTVIEELNAGDFGAHFFDINNPEHSAVMYRHTLVAPTINQQYERSLVFFETLPGVQIEIIPTDHDGIIYNDFVIPVGSYQISSEGAGEPIEDDEATYWHTYSAQSVTSEIRSYLGSVLGAPICSNFAYNVDYDPTFTDTTIEDNIANNVAPPPECDTFDIVCHIANISQALIDGVTEAFLAIFEMVWAGVTLILVPPDGYFEVQFPNLLATLDEQFGFLLYPLVFIEQVWDMISNTEACGVDCSINFGGFFGQDLEFSPIGIRESLPAVYNVSVIIIRALFSWAIVSFTYKKYKELFRR